MSADVVVVGFDAGSSMSARGISLADADYGCSGGGDGDVG